jgi:hypothetical protein
MPARFSNFFALYPKKWRKWRALPAGNTANKAGIPILRRRQRWMAENRITEVNGP